MSSPGDSGDKAADFTTPTDPEYPFSGNVPRDVMSQLIEQSKVVRAQAQGRRRSSAAPSEAQTFDERLKSLTLTGKTQRLRLKRHLAYGSFGAIGLQLAVADIAFFVYCARNSWHINASIMISWLSATVIEVIGVISIIALNLFPPKEDE